MRRATAICLLILWADPAWADVVDAGPGGFSIRVALEVNAAPSVVFRAASDQVAAWWDPAHTWSGSAANLSMDLRPGGCFCEKLPAGGVQHLMVTYVDAPKTLRLSGGLGPLGALGAAGSLTWEFIEKTGRTDMVLRFNVGGYMPGGLNTLAPAVDQVLTGQMQRLKRFVETGRPE